MDMIVQPQKLSQSEETEIFVRGAFGDMACQWAAGTLLYSEGRYDEAYEWLSLSAAQGHDSAILLTANMLMEGVGVRRNKRAGFQAIKRLASAGNADAQYNLGLLLQKGAGTRQNIRKSLDWFNAAAQQGHVKAMLMLGMNYFLGPKFITGSDIAANPRLGIVWLERAALNGSKEAGKLVKSYSNYLPRRDLWSAKMEARGMTLLRGGR